MKLIRLLPCLALRILLLDVISWWSLIVWLIKVRWLLWHWFSRPRFENLRHQVHPFFRSALEVVLDGPVPERDEVVLFVVRRESNVLRCVSCSLSSTLPSWLHLQLLIVAPSPLESFPTRHNVHGISRRCIHSDTEQATHCAYQGIQTAAYQLLCAPCPRVPVGSRPK
jgi:hypothetical protein